MTGLPASSVPLDKADFIVIIPNSVNGVIPDAASFGIPTRGLRTELSYETTISTVEDTPETAARVFEPQCDQERTRHFAQSPPSWAHPADAGIDLSRQTGKRQSG